MQIDLANYHRKANKQTINVLAIFLALKKFAQWSDESTTILLDEIEPPSSAAAEQSSSSSLICTESSPPSGNLTTKNIVIITDASKTAGQEQESFEKQECTHKIFKLTGKQGTIVISKSDQKVDVMQVNVLIISDDDEDVKIVDSLMRAIVDDTVKLDDN